MLCAWCVNCVCVLVCVRARMCIVSMCVFVISTNFDHAMSSSTCQHAYTHSHIYAHTRIRDYLLTLLQVSVFILPVLLLLKDRGFFAAVGKVCEKLRKQAQCIGSKRMHRWPSRAIRSSQVPHRGSMFFMILVMMYITD